MKIIVDENVTHIAEGLRKLGYEALTIDDLRESGYTKRTDYSLLRYVESVGAVIVSNDYEVIDAAAENDIPYIRAMKLSKDAAVSWVDKELKKIIPMLGAKSE